jgi:hypothetical protein
LIRGGRFLLPELFPGQRRTIIAALPIRLFLPLDAIKAITKMLRG